MLQSVIQLGALCTTASCRPCGNRDGLRRTWPFGAGCGSRIERGYDTRNACVTARSATSAWVPRPVRAVLGEAQPNPAAQGQFSTSAMIPGTRSSATRCCDRCRSPSFTTARMPAIPSRLALAATLRRLTPETPPPRGRGPRGGCVRSCERGWLPKGGAKANLRG